MTVKTDRGNFSSFKDILCDMEHEGYDTIKVTGTSHIANTIHMGGLGVLTKSEIEKISKQMEG